MEIELYRHIAKARGDFEDGRMHKEQDLCYEEMDDAEKFLRQAAYKLSLYLNSGRALNLLGCVWVGFGRDEGLLAS